MLLIFLCFGFIDDTTLQSKGDNKKNREDVVNYFKSINNESSITVLPGDVSNLSYITTSDLISDEEFLADADLSYITQNIYFNYNSSTITDLGIKQLESLSSFLIDNKNVKVNISCYTDSRGNKDYNKKLSEQRGQNIRIYLLSKGITGERVIVNALGESNPVIDCEIISCDDDNHAKNRRAELKIIWN